MINGKVIATYLDIKYFLDDDKDNKYTAKLLIPTNNHNLLYR